MYETTRDFVAALEAAGELKRVKATVSPVLEITEIADRQSKSPAPSLPSARTRATDPRFHHLGGRALLFESVEGSDIPVLINQFGSYRRMEMALGCHEAGSGLVPGHTPGGLEALAARLGKLIKPEPPPTLLAKLQKLPELMELARIPPKKVRGGICQEVVLKGEQVDLTRLPLLRCWPLDGNFAGLGYPAGINDGIPGLESGPEWERNFRGRYITLGGIHTIHRDDLGHPAPPSRNIGMYRVQLFGKRHMAMHWHMHHDGARHWRSWKAKGEKMPVAIALGGESVLPYAATAPMPPGISELLLAGFLNRGAIPMCSCVTVPLEVPANSEIVIEGYVRTDAGLPGWEPPGSRPETRAPRPGGDLGPGAVFEGPFGDHTGFYSLPDRYPLLEVTAITHRRNPIYPTTVVGLPPQEDYFMGKATERLFLPLLRTIVHDIVDYDLPMFGAFHNCAFIKIRKEYPLQARRVMHSIWGAGQMAWTKTIFVVEEDVDVHDTTAVLRAAAERCRPGRDVETVCGPLDILDHAAPHLGAGTKIGFDCTRRWPEEEMGVRGRVAVSVGDREQVSEDATPASRDRVLEIARAVAGVGDVNLPGELRHGWLFLRIRKAAGGDGVRIGVEVAGRLAAAGLRVPVIMPLGPDVNVQNIDEALFHWCANFDFGRDARLIGDDGVGVVCQVFDATPKMPGDESAGLPVRDWPPIITMSEEIRTRVMGRIGALEL